MTRTGRRAANTRPGIVAGVRGRWHGSSQVSAVDRFLDRPYASVQLLLLAGAGLLGFGVLMAVSTTISASHENGGTGSIWGQVIREAEFIGLGLVIFWFAMRMSPRAFRFLAYPLLGLAIIALLAVLLPGVGVDSYGATRWIDIGPMQLQPSELAKVAMLLWGADLLARKQQLGTLTRAKHLFLPLLPGFALVSLLVMSEPDLGTTCCFMLILLGLLWMIGMPLRYFTLVLTMVIGAIGMLAVTASYRLARLTTFLHPFKDAKSSGYHTVEGLYALASGGLFGVGLGQGTSKYGWVPNANSDYVFAIIGEELGLIGCLAVLGLFALFAYTGMRIARRNADPFVRLAVGAATIWLCGQAVINIGYVSGLLPVTGIPLPLISAGGTSLLMTFFVLGMLVSCARHEAPAITAARKAERLARRSRLERWCRIPIPRTYVPPKRRYAGAPVSSTTSRANPRSGGNPRRDERLRDQSRRSSSRGDARRDERSRDEPRRAAAPTNAKSPSGRGAAAWPSAVRRDAGHRITPSASERARLGRAHDGTAS